MRRFRLPAALALTLGLSLPVAANDYEAGLRALYAKTVAAILADPALVAAVIAQNAAHAGLSPAEIDAMDKAWRAEVGGASRPTVDPVMTNAVSDMLRAQRDAAGGLFTEIFVMDARGLNVAASDVTSDYWQGDEAKWQETFAKGPGAIHISEVEFDESAQSFQTQLSVAITDPATGAVIGAATFGVNVDHLE